MSHGNSKKRDPSPSLLGYERSKSLKKSRTGLASGSTSESPQQISTAAASITMLDGVAAGLNPSSRAPTPSTQKLLKPMCFRISNIPPKWSREDLLIRLKSVDDSFDLSATDRLSLYPACSGRSQVALLNLMECSKYFQQLVPHRPHLIRGNPDLTVDSNFYGLTPLNSPEGDIIADVVAVTGLAGHAFGSWRNRTSGRMWLQDFLPEEINNIRIMTFGYDTTLTGPNASNKTIVDHRRYLVAQLETARCSSDKKRPLIFLGHSMGGILILQALLQCKLESNYKELLDATHTICFFGTPHQGLEGADIEAMLNRMSTTPQIEKLLVQLRESSDFLENQSDGIGEILAQCKVVSFYETKETPTIIMSPETGRHSRDGPLKEMVKKVSSLLRLPNERRVPVAGNHTDIVKFHAQSDPTYRTVVARIQDCVDATVRSSKTCIGVRLEASERSEILEWISNIPYTSHHRRISEDRLRGTGQWVFERQEYRDWILSPTSMLLLLRGIPGVGKTYIASTVVDAFLQLERPCTEKFAYFYCSRSEENRRQPEHILNALIQQLAQAAFEADTLLEPIVEIYSARKKEGQRSSQLSLEEAQELLVRLTDIYSGTTICIDALDEVENGIRIRLLKSLKYVVERSKNLVKIFATTRMDIDILRQFQMFPKIELQPDDNVSDINQFVKTKVQSAIDDGLLLDGDVNHGFKAEICDALCKRSKGMFQLAALQITFLCEMPTQNDIRQSLVVLPDTLMEAYNKIYQSILAQKGSSCQLALSAFRWIQSSYEPLQSETLLDAIAVEIGSSGQFSRNTVNANNLLKVCQNLLILDESLNVFRFAHLSVDEYLETKLPKIASHTEIAQVCLSLLCNPHYWNRYDRTLPTSEGAYEGRHLLLYSTTFWSWHFSHCEAANDTLEILSETFMSKNYRNWLLYHRSVVRVEPWTRDPFWRKLFAFEESKTDDDPIFSACVFGLSRTFEGLRSRINTAWLDTLLVYASRFGYLEIARLLINRGADVSTEDDYWRRPLHRAASSGNEAVAGLLIDGGANVSAADQYGRTPLHLALDDGHEAMARLLIDRGADVSAADRYRRTPLHLALDDGHEAMAGLLIDRGANVSAANKSGLTPLHVALEGGHEAMARLLIDRGANVSAANKYGRTPLHVALEGGHEAMARLLIDRGADVSAANKSGQTPLYLALHCGYEEVARLLIDRGVDISAADKSGRTPLHLAARDGHDAVARLLIDRGADVSAADKDGQTPLHLAVRNRRNVVAQILVDRGADVLAADNYPSIRDLRIKNP